MFLSRGQKVPTWIPVGTYIQVLWYVVSTLGQTFPKQCEREPVDEYCVASGVAFVRKNFWITGCL